MDGSRRVSRFEEIIATNEPILDTLLSHLPTNAIFTLYGTSTFLRAFLHSYPLAWRSLSFRLQQPATTLGSPSADPDARHSRQHALDLTLQLIVMPIATRLTNLDVCNTAVSGVPLIGSFLSQRTETLQHLSVRGCKNVSLKYHIVPFLRIYKYSHEFSTSATRLALKSLYTYRCRHHRRRPYLPSSLFRRDSDSEPTHELIELCHLLGIWTDTAWCPTPGPRCCRRKDYHSNRSAPGSTEVWVPFDRLWRSSNRIGATPDSQQNVDHVGKLWEENEYGEDGEALGKKGGYFVGEGKDTPAHQRWSHRQFVDDIKCDDCGSVIPERCETCSIKMHCMGCRKTLCSSCAFNKPYFRSPRHTTAAHLLPQRTSSPWTSTVDGSAEKKSSKFWWAPSAKRSPNLMIDAPEEEDSDEENHAPSQMFHNDRTPLKLSMRWCCLEPLFSGGGGVAFVGPGLGGPGQDRIRAVPLPKHKHYMDSDFVTTHSDSLSEEYKQIFDRFDNTKSANVDILPYLKQASLNLQATTCPRSICYDCYDVSRWKIDCHACNRAICKEHDFRALKVRKCGFRELTEERDYVRNPPKSVEEASDAESSSQRSWPRDLQIPAFRKESPSDDAASSDDRRARLPDDGQEESDAGSALDGPSTRDPSSTPRPAPGPSFDRSTSAFRSVEGEDDGETDGGAKTPRGIGSVGQIALRVRSVSMSDLVSVRLEYTSGGVSSQIDSISRKGKGKGKTRVSTLPFSKDKMLLPCSPNHPVQWQGCGKYFCQAQRAMGDNRTRCTASGKDCIECGVYVCEDCLALSTSTTPCDCTFCSSNYHCPHCNTKPHVLASCLSETEAEIRRRDAQQANSSSNGNTGSDAQNTSAVSVTTIGAAVPIDADNSDDQDGTANNLDGYMHPDPAIRDQQQQQLAEAIVAATQAASRQQREDADEIVQWGSEFWGGAAIGEPQAVDANGNATNLTIAARDEQEEDGTTITAAAANTDGPSQLTAASSSSSNTTLNPLTILSRRSLPSTAYERARERGMVQQAMAAAMAAAANVSEAQSGISVVQEYETLITEAIMQALERQQRPTHDTDESLGTNSYSFTSHGNDNDNDNDNENRNENENDQDTETGTEGDRTQAETLVDDDEDVDEVHVRLQVGTRDAASTTPSSSSN